MQLAAAALLDRRQSSSATNHSGQIGVDFVVNTSALFPEESTNSSSLRGGNVTDPATQEGVVSDSGRVGRLQPTSCVPSNEAFEPQAADSMSVSRLQPTLESVAEADDERDAE